MSQMLHDNRANGMFHVQGHKNNIRKINNLTEQ